MKGFTQTLHRNWKDNPSQTVLADTVYVAEIAGNNIEDVYCNLVTPDVVGQIRKKIPSGTAS